ncbi:MAG: glycosyltransferase [Nitrospinota bacterium]
MFLHDFFSKQALTTIVTNEFLKKIITCDYKATATIIKDVPIVVKNDVEPTCYDDFTVTFINSFADDEPLKELLDAARKLPRVKFFVTGGLNDARAKSSLVRQKPENVSFTGFLPNTRYFSLLKSSDAIIVLTTKDHTMQRGGYEAIYMRKPIIISGTGVLKEAFPKGAVFVDNSVPDIVRGILKMEKNISLYTEGAGLLRREKLDLFKNKKKELLNLMKAH